MLTLIVARARGGAIGRNGDIPWHAPEDLKLFQKETLGGAIVMGRRTWESLPVRPLKNRFNVVVTRSSPEGADLVCQSPGDAVRACYDAGIPRVYGIGGASIYAALMPMADRLMITDVDLDVPDADTFFPDVPADDFHVIRQALLRDAAPACRLTEHIRTR